MATSFLIMYPDVQVSALSQSKSAAFDEDFPIENTFDGNNRIKCKLETVNTSLVLTFDLGVGRSRTLDYLVLGGATELISASRTVQVEIKASLAAPWTTTIAAAPISAANALGSNFDEFIFTTDSTPSANVFPAQLFRVTFSGAAPGVYHIFDRLYLGQSFDMGKEPDSYDITLRIEREGDTWVYPRGHTIMSKAFYPKHRITVEWDGVPDSKVNELCRELLNNPYASTVYLYTKTYQDPLYNNKLMLCRIISEQVSITKSNDVKNWNDVVMVFEEI